MQTLIKKKPAILNANSSICCGEFENNVKKFSWLAYTNDGVNYKYIIPHIVVTDKFPALPKTQQDDESYKA